MELQVPYSIRTEVQKKIVLQRKESGNRKNPETTVRMEGGKNRRSGGVSGLCP